MGAVRLRGGFPTPERAREQARGCNRFIEGRGTYRYALKPLFRAGNRALVCYEQTRR
ncbi:hypothetical protein [Nocardioides nanhaiensis]|uniref:Uncharacterized protein n=1 Tax=Nocardioides nanhaiensis TaxID=1476871 RepID=A0ABP8VU94_9ACTN